jgi:hypothetical protein
MTRRRSRLSILTALVIVPCLFATALAALGQDAPAAPVDQAAIKSPVQQAAPAPRPPKERMAVYVLLAWIWFSIVTLLGFLRLRIREADRVFRMGLDRAAEKKPKESRP